ncbi:hypothetical protein HY546_01660 [archaeon]|nr:hypothetical protein [archaeon]
MTATISAKGLVLEKPVQNSKLLEALLEAGVTRQLAEDIAKAGVTSEAAQTALTTRISEIQKANSVIRSLYASSTSKCLSESAWLREKTSIGTLKVENYSNNFLSITHDLRPVFENGLVINGKPVTRKPKRLLSALSIAVQLIQHTQGLTEEHVMRDFNFMIADFSRRARDGELNEALQFFVYQCDATQPTQIEINSHCPLALKSEKMTDTPIGKMEKEAKRVSDALVSLMRDEKEYGKEFKNISIAWKSPNGTLVPEGLACSVKESHADGALAPCGETIPYGFTGFAQVFRLNNGTTSDEKNARTLLEEYRREFESQKRMSLFGRVRAYCVLRKG